MKKFVAFFLFVLVSFLVVFSAPVDKNTAKQVALNYVIHKAGKANYKIKDVKNFDFQGFKALYIVRFKPSGFVVMPADDRIKPVLAYSLENEMPETIDNPEVLWLLNNYAKQVKYAVEHDLKNPAWSKMWTDFKYGIFPKAKYKGVEPLIQTHWEQQSGFNAACPPGVQAGCVAIAMAQVMKYWNYPPVGAGWNGYRHPVFYSGNTTYDWGYLSAYFSETSYGWDNMQNNSATAEAAELVYHCGIAVNMFYTPWGSAANSGDVPWALANYFRYDPEMEFLHRKDFSDEDWAEILRTELDDGRPVLYSGSGSSGGHEFICDGYDDQGLFHFNLGWGGYADGYYDLENLNPGGYDFSNYNDALVNLHPATGNEEFLWTQKLNGYKHLWAYPRQIFPVNEKIVWTIPADGFNENFYRECALSVDGGLNFRAFYLDSLLDTNYYPTSIFAFDQNTAFVTFADTLGNGAVLKTTDGGAHWEIVFNANTGLKNIFFIDNQNFIITGDKQGSDFVIFRSDDTLQSISQIDGSVLPDALDGEFVLPARYDAVGTNFWFGTSKGRIFHTSDGGTTWNVSQLVAGYDTTDVIFAFDDQAQDGLAIVNIISADTVSQSFFFATSDGGQNWTQLSNTDNFMNSGVDFVPGTDKTFVSVGGEFSYYTPKKGISVTTDGGQTWQIFRQYYTARWFKNIKILSEQKAFAGAYGIGYSQPHKSGFWVYGTYDLPIVARFSAYNQNSAFDSLFCQNQEITFTSNSIGEINSYFWDFGADATPQTATGEGPFNVTYSSAGRKAVKLIVQGDYESDTSVKNILVSQEAPVLSAIEGPSEVLLRDTATYATDYYPNTYYDWILPYSFWEGESDSNKISVYFGGFDMTGDLQVVAYNGCGISDTLSITVSSVTGLSQLSENMVVSLYPNPAKNYVFVKAQNPSNIEIFSRSGEKIFENSFVTDNIILNTSNFEPGIYLIKITDKKTNETFSAKLVIEK